MLEKLTPDEMVDSIYHMDLSALQKKGIKAIIADLDNTLVPWGACDINPELLNWVNSVKNVGLQLAILSNNSPSRVSEMAERLNIIGISKAIKPRRGGFRSIAARFGLAPSQVAVVGDQLFTDILGGNRSGMYTILVIPLSSREFIGTRIMRRLERIFLGRIKKNNLA